MTVPEHTLEPNPPNETPTGAAFPPQRWRALVVRLHFYAGVLVGPFLLVAAITGGLYALAPTLEHFVYRDILTVEPTSAVVPLRDQVAAAQAAFPELTMTGMRPSADTGESTRIYFTDPALGEELMRAVFVDPHTARVLGTEPTWLAYLPISTWLDGLHRHLNLGEPGRVYSEIAASWLWVVALGGLYLWIVRAAGERRRGRRARLLTVDRGGAGRSRTLKWHGAVGVWLLVGLLFLSATGITWSTYAGARVTDIRSALKWERPQLDTALSDEHAGHTGPAMAGMGATDGVKAVDYTALDYDAVVDAAARAGVHLPAEITVPAAPGDGVGVAETDKPYRLTTNAASVNPVDYSVTGEVDYWRDYSLIAKLADWGIRAHMGLLFGLLNQLVLLGVAVGLLTVTLRGYRMWWQRRPTRGSAWALGRPPARGGFRRLQPVVKVSLGVAAVAVGWFLPLLGLTLAAFVAVDLTISSLKRRKAESHVH